MGWNNSLARTMQVCRDGRRARAVYALITAEAQIKPAMEAQDLGTASPRWHPCAGPMMRSFDAVQLNSDNATIRRNRLTCPAVSARSVARCGSNGKSTVTQQPDSGWQGASRCRPRLKALCSPQGTKRAAVAEIRHDKPCTQTAPSANDTQWPGRNVAASWSQS